MERSNAGKALGAVVVVLGIIVAIGPHYIFPVCQYFGQLVATAAGTTIPMKCFWTAQAEVGLGALTVIAGLLLILSRQQETRRMLGVFVGILGILVLLTPTNLIGMCMSADHPCRVGTEPFLILMGVVVLIVGIITIVTTRGALHK